jgi:hypothetical protein
MNKIIITLLIVFSAASVMQAQSNEMLKLFNKYGDKPGFELEVVKPGVDISMEEMNDFMSFIDDAKQVYLLEFEYKDGKDADHSDFKSKLKKIIKKYDFSSLMEVSDEEDDVQILLRKDNSGTLTDFLLLPLLKKYLSSQVYECTYASKHKPYI